MPVYENHHPEPDIDLDELIAELRPTRPTRTAEPTEMSLAERLSTLRYHWHVFAGVALVCAAVGAAVGLSSPARFGSAVRFVGEAAPTNTTTLRAGHPLAAVLAERSHTADMEAAALQDEVLVQEVRRRLAAPSDQQPTLTVRPLMEENVVEVSSSGKNAEMVARLPRLLIETYLEQCREQDLEAIHKAAAALRKEKKQAIRALRFAEHQLLAFKNRVGMIEGDETWLVRATQLSDKQAEYARGYHSLGGEIEQMRDQLGHLARAEMALSRLNRVRHEAAVRRERVDSLLKDLALWKLTLRPAGRILYHPEQPRDLRRLDQVVAFSFAGLMGLLLAGASALVCAQKDDRLHSLRQNWRWAGVPSLAQIPLLSGLRRRRFLDTCGANIDAYRTLRTSLRIASQERPLRTLLVTSAAPGEGRTTTALYLAKALTLENKRVVVVDANLHRPGVAIRCGVSEQPGLTELLQGAALVDDVLRPTQAPGLWVVPGGSAPPDSADLLASTAFQVLLADLQDRADVVIIDSPPALMSADAHTLAGKVDGVLLVVEMSRTRQREVTETRALLENARARVVGTVSNKVRKRHGTLVQFGRYR